MGDVSGVLTELFRWGVPLAGVLITFLAWRRYKAPGTSLAVAGFSLMLVEPGVRLVVNEMLPSPREITARDVAFSLYFISLVGGIGGVLLVLAMYRLISAATKASISTEQTAADESA